jgi:hypothetical protein
VPILSVTRRCSTLPCRAPWYGEKNHPHMGTSVGVKVIADESNLVRSNRKERLNRASNEKRLEVGQKPPRGDRNGWLIRLELDCPNSSCQGYKTLPTGKLAETRTLIDWTRMKGLSKVTPVRATLQ